MLLCFMHQKSVVFYSMAFYQFVAEPTLKLRSSLLVSEGKNECNQENQMSSSWLISIPFEHWVSKSNCSLYWRCVHLWRDCEKFMGVQMNPNKTKNSRWICLLRSCLKSSCLQLSLVQEFAQCRQWKFLWRTASMRSEHLVNLLRVKW